MSVSMRNIGLWFSFLVMSLSGSGLGFVLVRFMLL